MIRLLLLIFVLCFMSCVRHEKKVDNSKLNIEFEANENLEVYDFKALNKLLNKKNDTLYVINFWATWCAPCVKELPYFEKVTKIYDNSKVKVVLVSLDFPHLYEKKLKPFIKEKKLSSRVIALDDPDMNTWIPKVDEDWSGSIPATIIYKNDKRRFYEQSFTYEELEKELKPFLN